jgi:rhomboid protease GluP
MRKRCSEYALVLRAVGIRCEVLPLEGEFALLVHARDADRAQKQLDLYLHENRTRSPPFDPRVGVNDGLKCASLYGVTILLIDLFQRYQAFSLDWWDAGMSHAGLIQQGEWWRTLTSLSLHADPLHLIGNLAFGVLFGFLAGQRLGWGLAWFGMLLAGALGNALNALIQAPGHMSIGASTVVFATLGILASCTWKQGKPRVSRWMPVGSGIALLAFLGMSGERTDIFAHVAGFGSGCLLGALIWFLENRLEFLVRHQLVLGLAAVTLFAVSWFLALLTHG